MSHKPQQARALMNNPILAECFADMRSTAILQWESSNNPEKRDEAWHTMRAIRRMECWIKTQCESVTHG